MAEPPHQDQQLTRRERQIADAYAHGMTYKGIASSFGISPATVRTHLGTIYRKLGVSTKIGLLRALSGGAGEATGDIQRSTTGRPQRGRRQISVLCARIADLETVLERLDPEEAADAIQRFRTVVVTELLSHGGEELEAAGAEVFGCFGLRGADETDAERAVRCAVHLSRAVSTDPMLPHVSIAARIAVWSGMVAVNASIPNAARGAIHLAHRLINASEEKPVIVCPRTRSLLGNFFAFAPLASSPEDAKAPRGFSVDATVEPWSRFDALHGARLSPLVGRDREIGLLESLYRRAEEGEGQMLRIEGESGIGKSRTVRAFCEQVGVAPEDRLEFQCSPHAVSIALHPVATTLRAISSAEGEAPPEEVLAAAEALLADVLDPSGRDRDTLARLLSIDLGAAPVERASSALLREATLSLLDRFLCKRAKPGPIVVIFEDLHWADPMTRSWLERIGSYVSTVPVLVILTSRPEQALEPFLSGTSCVVLSRLPRAEAAALLAAQLGPEHGAEVRERILERAEGIPLYIEEIAHAHLELGQDLDKIPATLAGSLSARLDRLGPAREIAQAAAVVGRDFDFNLLEELLPHGPRALRSALARLMAARILVPRGTPGSGSYRFRHALIRDAAYESLLRARREALHLALAKLLIARVEDGATVEPSLIAEHLRAGGAAARATPFWTAAAKAALAKGAEREASALCRAGRAAATALEDPTARDAALGELLLLQHGADYSLGDIATLRSLAEEAAQCARRLGDRERLVQALHTKTYDLGSIGRFDEAIITAQECVQLSAELMEPNARILPVMMLGRSLFACGRFTEALAAFLEVRAELGEDTSRGLIYPGAINQTLSCRVWSALALTELGRLREARVMIEESDRLLPQVPANEHITLWTALGAGRIAAVRGQSQAVVDSIAPLQELCERTYPVYAGRLAMSLGPSFVSIGEPERGLASLDHAVEMMQRKAFVFLRGLLHAEHAHALTLAGRPEAAIEAARAGIAEAERFGDLGSLAWGLLRYAEALRASGNRDKAAAEAASAQILALRLGMRPILDRCARLIG